MRKIFFRDFRPEPLSVTEAFRKDGNYTTLYLGSEDQTARMRRLILLFRQADLRHCCTHLPLSRFSHDAAFRTLNSAHTLKVYRIEKNNDVSIQVRMQTSYQRCGQCSFSMRWSI